jgi:hypothetical protein
MRIIEALKEKGRPFEIPDCSREDLPAFFKEMGYKEGVEIGVYKGFFSKSLGKAGLRVYGVDPWMPYPGFDRDIDARKERQEYLYKRAQRETRGLDVVFIRKMSIEAVQDFDDESIDFIYIDGNHKLQYAVQDIMEWYPKIKKGGIISGHDYINPDRAAGVKDTIQVKFAVDTCARALHAKSYYILGEMNAKKGEKRDKYRSWFWRK